MSSFKLFIAPFSSKDIINLEQNYKPLRTIKKNNQSTEFNTDEIKLSMNNPVDVVATDSYDGSVNLFISDGVNHVRTINSGFAKLSDSECKVIDRMGDNNSNEYVTGKIDGQTRLFSTVDKYPIVQFNDVSPGGQLLCGNYTLYFKLEDKDGNATDFVCESGIISVFNGTYTSISTVRGGLQDERTDKYIDITLKNIDQRFTNVRVFVHRETSNLEGVKYTSTYELQEPYDVQGDSVNIIIYGTETSKKVSDDELNIVYNYYSSAKTQAVVQNMLFLGNLSSGKSWMDSEGDKKDSLDLSEFTLRAFSSKCVQKDSVGYINSNYQDTSTSGDQNKYEYYNPHNIYYRLGYWPDEFYRFGVVYIFNDGSRSQVFNLLGGKFDGVNLSIESNTDDTYNNEYNKYGVFLTPQVEVLGKDNVKPLAFEFSLKLDKERELQDYNIVGYYFVRQKRIPITIAQGLGVGVNRTTGVPMPWLHVDDVGVSPELEDDDGKYKPIQDAVKNKSFYFVESFLPHIWESFDDDPDNDNWGPLFSKKQALTHARPPRVIPFWSSNETAEGKFTYLLNHYENSVKHYGLLCTDAFCIQDVQELVSGDLYLQQYGEYINKNESTLTLTDRNSNVNNFMFVFCNNKVQEVTTKFIPLDSSKTNISKNTKNGYVFYNFATRVGDASSAYNVSSLVFDPNDPETRNILTGEGKQSHESDLIRGNFAAFIGVTPRDGYSMTINGDGKNSILYGVDNNNKSSKLFNIRLVNLQDKDIRELEFQKRQYDDAPYYTVSDIFNVEKLASHVVYRGDCFTCTTTTRMQWNFVDPDVPVADTFVNVDTWKNNFTGIWGTKEGENDKINRADINAIQLGYWLSYKCMSNYNLGFRSEDTTKLEEIKKLGNSRSFYPYRSADLRGYNKMPDSNKLNIGYSSSLPIRKHIGWKETPYEDYNYRNRVAFSNVQISDAFENAFKVFQTQSYQDIDATYGQIIKLIPYGSDIFCVFEHGCGIIPINEKALMHTSTGSAIHIYGAGVIPEKISLISTTYGSTWHDSIIQTPNGIYGVDTSTQKIWRFNSNGFELISDVRIQRFLNERLQLHDANMYVGVTNVKTHYNGAKGDLMFTFYKEDNIPQNLCYNELLGIFTCKYTWVPLESATLNNVFYSIPLKSDNVYKIFKHSTDSEPSLWYNDVENQKFEFEFVVSQPTAMQKIYDNLIILSNNAQPDSLEITIVGDDYELKFGKNIEQLKDIVDAEVFEDSKTHEILLKKNQECKNIKEFGRRIGNIEYKEDLWYTTLQPMTFKVNGQLKQARLRNMWAKIRIKYKGNKLAMITSIMTMIRTSYS